MYKNLLEDRAWYDNTVGSRVGKDDRAYIAGFLDGDGSLMLQLKKRGDTAKGIRIMATVCLYQDTRHEKTLFWIRKVFGIGYLSQRNDGMTELRINGFAQVARVIADLLPYIRFKKIQARALLKACTLLQKKRLSELSVFERRTILKLMLGIQRENYQSRTKRSEEELCRLLALTP
ncbi:LAGLIDADG family homing endonuclease [Candidatus Kaiserbacteria bacterium]|nr:LAGLIDADG family homing endonuclease [Candidatus Kaiserbacteria bacterium]